MLTWLHLTHTQKGIFSIKINKKEKISNCWSISNHSFHLMKLSSVSTIQIMCKVPFFPYNLIHGESCGYIKVHLTLCSNQVECCRSFIHLMCVSQPSITCLGEFKVKTKLGTWIKDKDKIFQSGSITNNKCTYRMKMYKCKPPWDVSKFVSDKTKILQFKINKTSTQVLKGKKDAAFSFIKYKRVYKLLIIYLSFLYLDWSVFGKFIPKHFLISIFIQSTNNQNMSRPWIHINYINLYCSA